MKINEQKSRQAIGLPEYYCPLNFDNNNSIINQLRTQSINEILSFFNDHQQSLESRYIAGQLLALLGDPRIDVYSPTMVTVPKSQAVIGCNRNDIEQVYIEYKNLHLSKEWLLKESPQHTVNLASFRIGKFPITNKEYRVFLLDTQHQPPASWMFGKYDVTKSNHPVFGIRECDAEKYCQWLSDKTARFFRLPTEAEWEFSASGPKHFKYPWGNEYKKNHGNSAEEGIIQTTPVGLFLQGASPFGLLDMAGNVEEFTADQYTAYPGGTDIYDDLGGPGSYRIARGGSFTRHSDLMRTSRRHGYYPKNIYLFGFRLAESIEATE